MERITSSQNPLLQHIRKLQTSRSYREQTGEFVADGFKLLTEAITWCKGLKTVILSEGCPCPELPAGVRVVEIPVGLMERLSSMRSPQGVIFTCTMPSGETGQVEKGMLLLDRIQDPGNLGTILRTADAFDIPVLLTNDCADPFSEKTIRASMGAVFRSPIRRLPLDAVLQQCVQKEIPLAATALSPGAKDLRSFSLKDYATVIGSEGQGICAALLEASRVQMVIPMSERCESLNAAVAATIVMWQIKFG